jgi:hypothetical protein
MEQERRTTGLSRTRYVRSVIGTGGLWQQRWLTTNDRTEAMRKCFGMHEIGKAYAGSATAKRPFVRIE